MHYRVIYLPFIVLCLLCRTIISQAQDVLMAKDNAQITLGISPINFNGCAMKISLDELKRDELDHLKRFDYDIQFSKPVSLTVEYALSSYTTVGINANYFSYDLKEAREDDFGSTAVSTKGKHFDLHLRAVRYIYQSTGSALYLLAEAGASVRSVSYTNEDGSKSTLAYINTFPETRPNGFHTFSYDYGFGARARLFKTVGISAEFTMLSLLGRYGLFYIIQPAGRRSKDKIGW